MVPTNLSAVLILCPFLIALSLGIPRRRWLPILCLLPIVGALWPSPLRLPALSILAVVLLLSDRLLSGFRLRFFDLVSLWPLLPLAILPMAVHLRADDGPCHRIFLLTLLAMLGFFPFSCSREPTSRSMDSAIVRGGLALILSFLLVPQIHHLLASRFFFQLLLINLAFNGFRLHHEVRIGQALEVMVGTNLIMALLPALQPGSVYLGLPLGGLAFVLSLPFLLLLMITLPRMDGGIGAEFLVFEFKGRGTVRPIAAFLSCLSLFSLALTPLNPLFWVGLKVAENGPLPGRHCFGLCFLFAALVSIFWCLNFTIINFLQIARGEVETGC